MRSWRMPSLMSRVKDLTGQRFGKLTVVSRAANGVYERSRWNCVCDCEGTTTSYAADLKRGHSTSCGCKTHITLSNNHGKIGKIPKSLWTKITSDARRRGLEIEVSHEYISELLSKQSFKCALSGIELYICSARTDRNASLDRIDSLKGYTMDNIQWVHKDVNRMKNIYDEAYFIDMCRRITENREKQANESKRV